MEYKFQDQENSKDIFSFGSSLENFICVVFVLDRNIEMDNPDMTIPPRNERHEWLRFDTQGYTKEEIHDFETRLGKIFYRKVHRVQTLDFDRVAEIEDLDMDITERLRMQHKDVDGE
ncbi:hypothetical protein Tco_0760326, partial [Tanacetum coccineum]